MDANQVSITGALPLSTETIIVHIRSIRDKRLQEILKNDEALMDVLEDLYNTIAISSVKREFIQRDLAELKNSTLDLVHYSSLITAMRKNPETISPEASLLFIEELRKVFSKYSL